MPLLFIKTEELWGSRILLCHQQVDKEASLSEPWVRLCLAAADSLTCIENLIYVFLKSCRNLYLRLIYVQIHLCVCNRQEF